MPHVESRPPPQGSILSGQPAAITPDQFDHEAASGIDRALPGLPTPSGLSGPAPTLEPSTHEASAATPIRSYVCQYNGCQKRFVRPGDLNRHERYVHSNQRAFRCHFHRCTRGVPGCGFSRKDKLVDHLKSRYHGLSHDDARYEAGWHNRLTRFKLTFRREHDGCIESN